MFEFASAIEVLAWVSGTLAVVFVTGDFVWSRFERNVSAVQVDEVGDQGQGQGDEVDAHKEEETGADEPEMEVDDERRWEERLASMEDAIRDMEESSKQVAGELAEYRKTTDRRLEELTNAVELMSPQTSEEKVVLVGPKETKPEEKVGSALSTGWKHDVATPPEDDDVLEIIFPAKEEGAGTSQDPSEESESMEESGSR